MKVLKIDKETGKISLSLKQAMADPWNGVGNALCHRHRRSPAA